MTAVLQWVTHKNLPVARDIIDIKYFALCEWTERDYIRLERIDTSINAADHLTKPLTRALFHRHADYLLGHVPPKYSPVYDS